MADGRWQMAKDKGQRTKGKGQRAKGKGQRAKGKGQRAKGKGQRTKDKGQRTNATPRWLGRIRPTGRANQRCQLTQPTRISYAVCVQTAMPKPRTTKTQAKNTPAIQRNTKANQRFFVDARSQVADQRDQARPGWRRYHRENRGRVLIENREAQDEQPAHANQ